MADLVVEAKDLTKSYIRTRALDGLSLDIKPGVILGLLGPNGAGKSTFLKILAGLVKPSSGEVFVNGEVPGSKTKATVAYLPEIDYLYSWMTVKETVEFVSSFYGDWSNDKAQGLLAAMNLDPQQQVGKLSKGMRARLKIVLPMSRNASLILLDEPLSGIDVPSRSKIVRAIVSEYKLDEQTIILSTHEVADTENVFDEIVMLEAGRVKLRGEAEQLRMERGKSIQELMEEEYA